MFAKCMPPVVNMGGLYQFEKAVGVSAPEFIERLVGVGSENPDAALAPDVVENLTLLIAFCFDGAGVSKKSAVRLLKRSPDLVALALRGFLEDPLPLPVGASPTDAAASAELPSVLDMRAAWLAGGAAPDVFDALTLWEHSRILRQQEKRQRAALADAAVAARVAQSKDDQFRRFISEMHGTARAKTHRE